MTGTLLDAYTKRHGEVLVPVAAQLEQLVRSHLGQAERIDRVTARAKTPDRFVAKAGRVDTSGEPKYSSPLTQIQDQVAARVVVFYLSDVDPVGTHLLKYFRHIEERTLVPESEWEFGYFGRHYVLALPAEAVPNGIPLGGAPRFFELQVKTLFQHAWSEAEHDLGYKPREGLSGDQKRRLAFTAAESWGADRVFDELWQEVGRSRG